MIKGHKTIEVMLPIKDVVVGAKYSFRSEQDDGRVLFWRNVHGRFTKDTAYFSLPMSDAVDLSK